MVYLLVGFVCAFVGYSAGVWKTRKSFEYVLEREGVIDD